MTLLAPGTPVPVYEATLDDPSSSSVITLSAADADAGANGRVRFELLNENVHFSVGERSGEIKLRENARLGGDRVARKELYVRARDDGIPERVSYAVVVLTIRPKKEEEETTSRTTIR